MKPITVILILFLLSFSPIATGSVKAGGLNLGDECQQIAAEIAALEAEKSDLQAQLQDAPPNQKAGIVAKIKSINTQIAKLQSQLLNCQCPKTPPPTANLLQLTGTSTLTSASLTNGEQLSLTLQLKNLTAAPVTIKRAELFFANADGWAITTGDMIAANGNFMGIAPTLPGGANFTNLQYGYSWSMPVAYVIFVIEAVSGANTQELITQIPINSPGNTPVPPLPAERRVFIGLQGPVEFFQLSTGQKWLSVIGQVINGTGKPATVKNWKLELRDSLGKLILTASDQKFFDANNRPAAFNSDTSLNKFLYGFALPSNFTQGNLTISAMFSMEGQCQQVVRNIGVTTAPVVTLISPVVGLWTWGNGPGALGFHSHNTDTGGRYAYDLGIQKDVNGRSQSFSGDPAVNESYFCWNQPIYCVEGGVVEAVDDTIVDNLGNKGSNPGNPNKMNSFVVVRHANNRFSAYVHIRQGSAQVFQGQQVSAGTMLARVGNAGQSSEPHLHFGYYMMDVTGRLRGLPTQFRDLLNLDSSPATGVPINGGSFLIQRFVQ